MIKLNYVKGEFNMPFTEICVYQVKPQKVDEFETLMLEVKSFLEKQEGLLLLRFTKREYHIDLEQIKEGLPPPKLTRIVKALSICFIGSLTRKKIMELHKKTFMIVIGNLSKSA